MHGEGATQLAWGRSVLSSMKRAQGQSNYYDDPRLQVAVVALFCNKEGGLCVPPKVSL